MSKLPHILTQLVCIIEKLDYSQHVFFFGFFAGLLEGFFCFACFFPEIILSWAKPHSFSVSTQEKLLSEKGKHTNKGAETLLALLTNYTGDMHALGLAEQNTCYKLRCGLPANLVEPFYKMESKKSWL